MAYLCKILLIYKIRSYAIFLITALVLDFLFFLCINFYFWIILSMCVVLGFELSAVRTVSVKSALLSYIPVLFMVLNFHNILKTLRLEAIY